MGFWGAQSAGVGETAGSARQVKASMKRSPIRRYAMRPATWSAMLPRPYRDWQPFWWISGFAGHDI